MLFDQIPGEPIYVVDTSGLIYLESIFKPGNYTYAAIWEEIEDLISKGQFRIIDFVEDEINDYEGKEEFLKQWVKLHKKQLVASTDANSIKVAKEVINKEHSSGFLNTKKQAEGKEEADPFLIGYCKVHNCVLVTSERKKAHNKLPAIANKNGVRCIDIHDFLTERGLKMERRKR